eukprot:CAMPEP_0115703242 /NCGR_PEP_ID=MMETSP0272-20121206/68991_1 /TAXON_ID=71861 /ORGANISM="Scrippsiella trochoidea, Strain CCMP3099" /LENGTH=89 /DNA_ID=CAMNT_0003144087 /DNA_START=35 /DNA_END=305 /DNA_ORIENTATION=+
MQLQGLAHLPLLLCLPFFPRQSMRRFLQLMEAIRNRGNCCKACAFGLVELVAEKAQQPQQQRQEMHPQQKKAGTMIQNQSMTQNEGPDL